MTKTEYLYGDLPEEIIEKQNELARMKIHYAQELQVRLLQPSLQHRDDRRLRYVAKAIKHNEEILKECKD